MELLNGKDIENMEKKIKAGRDSRGEMMNLLLFLCFFFYMILQFSGVSSAAAARLGLLLYLVFVPGFVFLAGWYYGRSRGCCAADRKKRLLAGAGCCYGLFFVLTFIHELLPAISGVSSAQRKYVLISVFTEVLSFLHVPAVSALFLTLALMLLAVRVFDENICRLAENKKKLLLTGAVCLLTAFLQMKGETYELAAVFFGAAKQQAVPGVPYFAYFLFGMWLGEKDQRFDRRTAAAAAAVSALSLLLYRTPAKPLALVTLSAFPVYVLYGLSGFAPEFSRRFVSGRRRAPGGPARREIRHKTAVYFAVYTAAFSFLLFLVFFEYVRTGRTFIVLGDGTSQYFPRAIYVSRYLKKMVSDLLSGNFKLMMYDFRIGLGAEVSYSMEPLYFLFALFPKKYMEFAYDFITVLRFYLAGLSMSVLCLYFKKGYFASFLASTVYVISGFPLYGATMHTNFMIPLIMLPLLILSIEEILRGRRWYLCTIFTAVSLYSNYYYLYMNTIAMGIYFLVRFFCRKEKKTFKDFLKKGLVISGSYLLGVAMASIVLVTNFGVYLGSGRSGSVLIKTPSLFYYRPDWLVSCFLTFITTANSPGEWMKFGFLPIAMLAVVLLFMRKGRKELKILLLLSFIFTAFPLFGFIFSGFSSVLNRWCYMAALVAAFITADCLPDLYRMSRQEKTVCAAVILLYGILAFFGNYKNTGFTQAAFFLLAAAYLVLLVSQQDKKFLTGAVKRGLMILLTVVTVFWQGFSLFHMAERADSFMKKGGSALKKVANTPLRAVEETGDESFYRVAAPNPAYYNSNSSLLFDYNGISLVNSTYNGYIMEYLEEMGSTSYSPTQLYDLNNSTYMNNLAAVKYYASYKKSDRARPCGTKKLLQTELPYGKATVYENKYALPIGYTYRDSISEEELESYGSVERQEVLMQKVLLHDDGTARNTENPADTDILITAKELEIDSVTESRAYLTEHALTAGMEEEVSRIKSAETGEEVVITPEEGDRTYDLTLNFEGMPNSETYLVLEDAFLEGDMSEKKISLSIKTKNNLEEYSFAPDDYRYKTGQKNFVFNLGYHKDAITSCKIKMGRKGMIQFEDLKLYSLPMDNLKLYTENLTEHVLEDVKVETNRVTGRISLDEDRILVLSIPYQRGWTALVDGEKTQLRRANYMYMALELGPGEHTVELTYEIPGIRWAFAVTGAALALFLALLGAGRLRKKYGKRTSET